MLPPDMQAVAITFLIQIGLWAKDELSETWKLRRTEQEAAIDLAKKEQVEADAPALLAEVTQQRGTAEVERTIRLIEQKQGLIVQWKQAVIDAEQEHLLGTIPLNALNNRKTFYHDKISAMMQQIAADLESLGLDLERGA